MKGIGRAWGAISFVNALSTGVGAAAAVSLEARAEITITPARKAVGTSKVRPESDTPLVRRSLMEAVRRLGPGGEFDASLTLTSEIPPSQGLKSSSAVAVAIYRAASEAWDRRTAPEESARFASEIGRAVGVSATGAYDDALAAALGGVVVAETDPPRLVRREILDPDWTAVVWTPPAIHDPAPRWLAGFRARSEEAQPAVEAARRGRYLDAMERNTELVERIMGYSYRALRETLRRHGALASGVSGLGPALAAIAPSRARSSVLRAMPVGEGTVLPVQFAGEA